LDVHVLRATQNFMVVPALIATMIILYRGGVTWPRLFACALLVEAACLCLANGLLGWLLLLPMLVFLPRSGTGDDAFRCSASGASVSA